MKVFVALFVALFVCSANAEDVADSVVESGGANVSERITCDGIKAQLAALEVSDENMDEINKLKSDYRKYCTPRAAKRRASDTAAILYAKTAQTKTVPASVDLDIDESKEDDATEQPVKVAQVAEPTKTEQVESTALVVDTTDVAADDASVPSADTPSEADIALEKELANLAAGLCADGAKPNKYGCCDGEVFKDLGNLVFACCPKDGGDCYEPIEENVSER